MVFSIRQVMVIGPTPPGTAEKIVGCVKCRTLECLPDADAAKTCMKDIEA